ncbi:hypothetical protein [Streptomyces sp. NPDC049040]|uniref:hypothetical protein n=1 Tax=Streptomyces sp. NPDC049040 TaxID=3365593 RepID=UPI00372353A4
MALVKKGSRLITVGGAVYRWRLRGRPTYDQGLAAWPMTYAVEQAEAPGTTLVVTTDQPHTANWFQRQAAPVLPSDVAAAIRDALARGWTPGAPGRPFLLDLSAGFDAG